MASAPTIAATPSSHIERAGTARVQHHRVRAMGAGLFLVALFLPLVGAGLKWDPVASSENRVMAKFPGMPKNFKQVKEFSDLFMGFYRDHFGFRNTLIRALAVGRFHGGLGMDRGTNIIIGKDGFLFYPSSVQDGFLAERNLDPFSPEQLDEWQQLLERRHKFFAQHGIPFILVIPPDKQSIYTDKMPEEFSRLGPKTRLDQLIERLRETHSPVQVVDLRPVLLEAKKDRLIYYKTDTHWNDYGAFAAYPVILDAIQSVLPGRKLAPQPLSDFIPRTERKSGDLAHYMDLYYEYVEDWPELERRIPFPRISSKENPYVMVVTHGPDPTAPKLFIYHDSFTISLGQFLGPHFSTATWQWTNTLDGQEALDAKPDVVVDEFLERLLYSPVPPDSEDIHNEKLPEGASMTLAESSKPASPAQRIVAQSHPFVRNAVQRFLAVLFIAALVVPLVGAWRKWDPSGESHENRRLATRPILPHTFKEATLYSDRWLNFYRDHFGFRNTLIRGVALTRFHGLGADTDGRVLVGRNGWLFLRPDGDQNFIAFRGLNPFSDDELNAWQHVLEQRAAWLAAQGIPCLFVIPPNKETIYPEFLPDEISPIRPPSRLDQLVKHVRDTHSPIHLLDLRPALFAAKKSGRLYFKTDTHWNDLGAYVAYCAIMDSAKELLPGWKLVPQPRSNFVPGTAPVVQGDLARMMDMSDQYPDEWLSLTRKIPFDVPAGAMDPHGIGVTDVNDPTLPRLVFYHDSFAIALGPMIGPNFKHVYWSFNYEIDPKVVEREKPDLVIDEFLERNLYLDAPTDAAAIRLWDGH